jgi:hypothetical protein
LIQFDQWFLFDLCCRFRRFVQFDRLDQLHLWCRWFLYYRLSLLHPLVPLRQSNPFGRLCLCLLWCRFGPWFLLDRLRRLRLCFLLNLCLRLGPFGRLFLWILWSRLFPCHQLDPWSRWIRFDPFDRLFLLRRCRRLNR